jgi:hypothetical protein
VAATSKDIAKPPLGSGRGGDQIPQRVCFGVYSPPRLRELRMLRGFLLIAQTPLIGQEGKVSAGWCAIFGRALCPQKGRMMGITTIQAKVFNPGDPSHRIELDTHADAAITGLASG